MVNETRGPDGTLATLEADPATPDDDRRASDAGLAIVREVLQLRRPLPAADPPPIALRAFVPGDDDLAFLEVNNRAFAWHPDQGGWTPAQLAERTAEPWFDPAGFLLHERDGRLLGFCWTKVHPPTAHEPELGEIFVIAVDPEAHGRGLGRALTLAGLHHMATAGVSTGMLHVESTNVAARHLYDDLGFQQHSAHRWWARSDAP
jgi:mycothiol synthase